MKWGFELRLMSRVNLKAEGPIFETEVVHETDSGVASVDHETNADGMKNVGNQELAELIIQGKKEICQFVVDLEDTDYYITDVSEWQVRVSGKNETLPIAIAADIASERGDYKNSLEALLDWSNDQSFPFKRKSQWLSTECAKREIFENIEQMYRDNLMR